MDKETPNNERFKAAFWEQPIPCRSRSISTPAVDTSWKHAFGVVRSHSIFPILSLGLLLAVILRLLGVRGPGSLCVALWTCSASSFTHSGLSHTSQFPRRGQ